MTSLAGAATRGAGDNETWGAAATVTATASALLLLFVVAAAAAEAVANLASALGK
jgi:hypothetical protein